MPKVNINKSTIGQLVKVTWYDPQTQCRITLTEFLKSPLAKIETVGVVAYYNSEILVLCSEQCCEENPLADYTAIHRKLVINLKALHKGGVWTT